MFHIHIIEDDKNIREELALLLERNEYKVSVSKHFESLAQEIFQENPNLVLLDLNLPYVDGHVVCREIREHSDVPIIVVTSRNSDLDELMSMNLGADDFITKPYSPHILLARVANLLRRSYKPDDQQLLHYEGLSLDATKNLVGFGENTTELTRNEMRILQILMRNAERIISRQEIQNELWQSEQFIDDNTLTVNVNRLRAALDRIGASEMLHTKRGQGYYLKKDA